MLALGTPQFYIAPYGKINHGVVKLSDSCDVKSGLKAAVKDLLRFEELFLFQFRFTVICLSIQTPENHKFSIFLSNGRLIFVSVPKFRQIAA